MTRIAVIGANGFLGSHLVDALVRNGQSVTAFDRFSNGSRRFTSEPDNIIVGDFLSNEDLAKAMKSQDIVFHMLSLSNPANTQNSVFFDIDYNLRQSINLLNIASRSDIEHLYFASSGGTVYGDQNLDTYSEMDATKPISPYGIGKLTVEHYLRYFEAVQDLKSTTLRISNPYGPRQNSSRGQGIIAVTLSRVSQGLPAIMFGDGSMLRDYIFIDDLIYDVIALMERPRNFNLYNLGSGVGHSVQEIFMAIRTCLNHDFEIEYRSKPASFVERVVLDTSRVDAELGVRARTPLLEGVSRTIEWLR